MNVHENPYQQRGPGAEIGMDGRVVARPANRQNSAQRLVEPGEAEAPKSVRAILQAIQEAAEALLAEVRKQNRERNLERD